MPTTPPIWSFEGSSPWSMQAFFSTLSDAWTRNGPRYLVGQLRFSMSLEPRVMREAQGWRIDKIFTSHTPILAVDPVYSSGPCDFTPPVPETFAMVDGLPGAFV